jgi:two-component system, LuxR family, sensor kinase FixL
MRRRTRAGGKSAKRQRRQTLTVPKAVNPHPALAAAPDALRLVLETALDAVIVMKSDGVVADWNDRAAGVFGWSRDEAVGRTMADLIIPERYREAHRNGLQRYLETGIGSVLGTRVEVAGLKKNGTEFPVELSISPVRNGESVLFVGCLRDMTERNALRLARGEVSRVTQQLAMGEMAASIVCEIGQPLKAIAANANASLRRLAAAPDLDEVRSPLQRVVEDSQRANEVIEKIRLIFNPDPSPKALLDVNNLIREVITLVRGEIENQRVSVRTELANDLPLLSANLSQLQQVIVNLVTNAIEAMHGVADRYRVRPRSMTQDICLSPWKIPEQGSIQRTATASLSRSLQRNPIGWAWGCRFAGRSSPIMAGAWQWPPVSPKDRSSRYFYRFERCRVIVDGPASPGVCDLIPPFGAHDTKAIAF